MVPEELRVEEESVGEAGNMTSSEKFEIRAGRNFQCREQRSLHSKSESIAVRTGHIHNVERPSPKCRSATKLEWCTWRPRRELNPTAREEIQNSNGIVSDRSSEYQ